MQARVVEGGEHGISKKDSLHGDPHQHLYDMLVQRDEVTWQTIIHDLVKSEELDPWNIDISILSHKFLETIKKMHEMNFFISGKVLLASALLLKMKSDKLVHGYMADFDAMLFPPEEAVFEEQGVPQGPPPTFPPLLIKTPQERKKQLTLNDLMEALGQALRVEEKRKHRLLDDHVIREVQLPERTINITQLIKDIYGKIVGWFSTKQTLTFDELVGSPKKEDKILTLIPLLHLDNNQKINMHQEVPFGTITIELVQKHHGA